MVPLSELIGANYFQTTTRNHFLLVYEVLQLMKARVLITSWSSHRKVAASYENAPAFRSCLDEDFEKRWFVGIMISFYNTLLT